MNEALSTNLVNVKIDLKELKQVSEQMNDALSQYDDDESMEAITAYNNLNK